MIRRLRRKVRTLRRNPAASIRELRDRLDKLDIVQFGLRRAIVGLRVRHHSGPKAVAGGLRDPIVFCLLRNGMPWLEAFLHHHRALGFRHFVMLDNGSSDGTFEALAGLCDVTLLQTNAPYKAYENTLKRYLVDRFGHDRWCLFVDIDEQFDWPLRASVPLERLIFYLETTGANCVITQMLDMFADRPLADMTIRGQHELLGAFPFYELSNIRRQRYHLGDAAPVEMHWGGIRKALFGTDNGLTKVSLFRNTRGLSPFTEWHHVRRGRFSDVSSVLYHFPFESGFVAKVREAIESGRYGYHTTQEYVAYGRGTKDAELRITSPDAIRFTGTDALIDQGFLKVSDRYRAFAQCTQTVEL